MLLKYDDIKKGTRWPAANSKGTADYILTHKRIITERLPIIERHDLETKTARENHENMGILDKK
jgi:hypothetical protein